MGVPGGEILQTIPSFHIIHSLGKCLINEQLFDLQIVHLDLKCNKIIRVFQNVISRLKQEVVSLMQQLSSSVRERCRPWLVT